MRSRQSESSATAVISRASSFFTASVALKWLRLAMFGTPAGWIAVVPRAARGHGRGFAQMACDPMRWQHFRQCRLLHAAAVERIGASRVKAAAGRKLDRTGHVAGQNDALAPRGGVRHRDR